MDRDETITYLKKRIKERRTNPRRLALDAGLHEDVVRNFFRGNTQNLRLDYYHKLLEVLDGDSKQIAHKEEETASIPVYDIRASAGNGMVIHDENILYHISFRLDFLHRVSNAPLEKLSVITVDGDSMEPTLSPEDTVLIDRTQTTPKKDGIYVLRYDDSLLVKRLRYDPQRRIVTIISDNDRYPPLDITDLDCLHVIGRVLWLGRRV